MQLLLDEQEWATCSDAVVAEFRLYQGREVDGDELESLRRRIAETDALGACHVAVSLRSLTASELAGKLRDKGFADDVADLAVRRSRELGLVDDELYARSFAAVRQRRGHGARRIRVDLSRRGIDSVIIDGVLAELDRDDFGQEASRLLERKFRTGDLSDPKDRARAQRFLLGRGFDADQVHAAVRQLQQQRRSGHD